jgi:hypothetical protein
MFAPADPGSFGPQGDPQGDPVQPAAEHVLFADLGGVLCQHHESGLEGVLGVLDLAQRMPTDAPNQARVPPHQGGEGSLVALAGELTQQLGVGQFPVIRARRQAPEVAHDRIEFAVDHERVSSR